MNRKIGAFITDSAGRIYDVNAEYLFDPKISTYVTVPAQGSLTIIGNANVKDVYAVTDGALSMAYGDKLYGPTTILPLSKQLNIIIYKMNGTENTFKLVSKSDEDINVYFITYESVSLIGVMINNNITPTSTINPIPTTVRRLSTTISKGVLETKKISDNPFNGHPVVVQDLSNDYANPKLIIAGFDFDGDFGYVPISYGVQIYDRLNNLTPAYDLHVPMVFSTIRGDGKKRAYYFGNAYSVLHELDIMGPPYPADSNELQNKIKEWDVDYSEFCEAVGAPQNVNIGCGTYNIRTQPCPLVVGDIDLDGEEELIIWPNIMWTNEEGKDCSASAFGYIKFQNGKFKFKVIKVMGVSCGIFFHAPFVRIEGPAFYSGPIDSLVVDYDGDGVPEIYGLSEGNGFLSIYRKEGDKWVSKQIPVKTEEEKQQYPPDARYVVRMVLYRDTIYIKTPTMLHKLNQDLSLKTMPMLGIGLRKIVLYSKEYLVTIAPKEGGGSYIIIFAPDLSSPPFIFETSLNLEDPQPFFWDTEDTMTIFAVSNTDTDRGVYKLDIRYKMEVSASIDGEDIEIGAVEIKDATTDQRAVVDADGNLHVTIPFDTLISLLNNPVVDELVANGETINSAKKYDPVPIGGAKQLEVIIDVEGKTGSPSMTVSAQVYDSSFGRVAKSYDSDTITDAGTYYIFVANDLLGDKIRIEVGGTLDSDDYFTGVTIHLIAKR